MHNAFMPTLTIRDVPAAVLDRLRRRAAEERRSLNQEAIHLLDWALRAEALSPSAQAEAWMRLGRWRSRSSAKQEIAEIYAARSRGRRVRL
jgi:plasmid stability protein